MNESVLIIIRSVITFLSLLIFCRLLGKTQISQLTFFEYVTGITLGSIAGVISSDLHMRPWPIYVGLITWVLLALLLQAVALKSRWIAKMLDGQPVILVQNGQILEQNLKSIRLRVGELNSLLRAQGVFDIKSVEFAVIEPDGDLSILKRSQDRPVTPSDLHIATPYEGLAVELIVDGEVMVQNLRRLGVNQSWLLQRIQKQGISSPQEVFHAVIDTQGRIYIDRYQDRVPQTDHLGDYPGPN